MKKIEFEFGKKKKRKINIYKKDDVFYLELPKNYLVMDSEELKKFKNKLEELGDKTWSI